LASPYQAQLGTWKGEVVGNVPFFAAVLEMPPGYGLSLKPLNLMNQPARRERERERERQHEQQHEQQQQQQEHHPHLHIWDHLASCGHCCTSSGPGSRVSDSTSNTSSMGSMSSTLIVLRYAQTRGAYPGTPGRSAYTISTDLRVNKYGLKLRVLQEFMRTTGIRTYRLAL